MRTVFANAGPMRYPPIWVSLAVLASACGTAPEPAPVPIYSPPAERDEPPLHRPLAVRIVTIGDIADAVGAHPDFVVLSNNVCARRSRCGERWGDEERRDPGAVSIDGCMALVTTEWCRTNDCSQAFMGETEGLSPCILNIRERACDDLVRPVRCEPLEAAGIVLDFDVVPPDEMQSRWDAWQREHPPAL